MQKRIIIDYISYFLIYKMIWVRLMPKKIKINKKIKGEGIKLFSFNDENFKATKGVHIEIFSNEYVYIENCLGIYEYSDMIIKLNIGTGSITFLGENMEIKVLEGKNITISGIITTIQYDL